MNKQYAIMKLIRRFLPLSIQRQLQVEELSVEIKPNKHEFERVIIGGKLLLINKKKLIDVPTTEEWFRIRVWNDEITGKSLTL